MDMFIFGLFILIAVYFGYQMGRGKELQISLRKFQPIIKTAEQVKQIEEKFKK